MFIKKLGLKNFKCFKDVEVDFAKITLLTGENSSGKSSLIYGILAPFQSEGFPFYLFPNGKYVNMGDFTEISFKHDKKNIIEININCDDIGVEEGGFYSYNVSTQWILDPINQLPKLYHLLGNQDFEDSDILEIYLDENNYLCSLYEKNDQVKISIIENLYIDISQLQFIESKYFGDSIAYYKNDLNRLTETIFDYYQMINQIQEKSQLNFIGSYRLYPERTYYQKPKATPQILQSGEGFIDQILEWQEQEDPHFDYLISILRKLKLLYDIKPQKIGGGRFDLRVKVKRNSSWTSLADVGFGVSQLLPILVADLQLSNYSTLIIAQPEIHLYPSIQAQFGNYLVKKVSTSDKQYIIETHSEYLINRLRLCIVKGEIEPDDVALYYFENTLKEGSIIHKIGLTKQGEILNAPQGFFDTYMIDTMDIALNA